MSEQISPEAREAAEKEKDSMLIKHPRGYYVQALLDSIHRQHAEELHAAKIGRESEKNLLQQMIDENNSTLTDLREQLRAKEERPRTERCCECGGYVSDWVEADHRNGRICKPCEALVALRAENERLKGELERAWITQGDLREQSEVLKDKMEGLRSQLEAVTKERAAIKEVLELKPDNYEPNLPVAIEARLTLAKGEADSLRSRVGELEAAITNVALVFRQNEHRLREALGDNPRLQFVADAIAAANAALTPPTV